MTPPPRTTRITFFDLEATGRDPETARVASIGAVTVEWPPLAPDLLMELGTFERRLTIDTALADPEALTLMRYSPERWAGAVQPYLAVRAFASYLETRGKQPDSQEPYAVAGHWAVGYDLPLWHREWRHCVARDTYPPSLQLVLDSCLKARAHDWGDTPPPGHGLAALHQHLFGEPVPDHHEALADARASARIAAALHLGWQGGLGTGDRGPGTGARVGGAS